MHHAGVVGVGQRGRDGRQRGHDLTRAEPAAPVEQLGQGTTGGQLQDQHDALAVRDQFAQAHQIRVVQSS